MTAREAMTPCPLTVTPRTSVAAALRLLRDNRIGHLPVVDQGRVLGVVRAERLLALTPSEATTLSRHEATDLLGRLTAGILTHSDLLRGLIAEAAPADLSAAR